MATTMLAGTPYWFCMAASCCRPLAHLAAPGRGEHVQRILVEIVRRDVELGLMDRLRRQRLRQRRTAGHGRVGQHEMRQRPVELEPLDIGVEGLARDARRFGIGPQRLQPGGEALLHLALIDGNLVVGRLRPHRRRRGKREHQGQTDPPKSRCRHPARHGLAPHDSRLPAPILAGALRRRKGKMARSYEAARYSISRFSQASAWPTMVSRSLSLRLPAEHLADPVGLGDDRGGIAGPARAHAAR